MKGNISAFVNLAEWNSFLTLLKNFQTKEISSQFKNISDEERAKWQAKADKAKEVYKKEVGEYEKTKSKDTKVDGKNKKKPESEESEDSDSESGSDDDSDWVGGACGVILK